MLVRERAKTSSRGLGAFAVISKEDFVSSILGCDMYCARRSVQALTCAAFCSCVCGKGSSHNTRSEKKVDFTSMPLIMRQEIGKASTNLGGQIDAAEETRPLAPSLLQRNDTPLIKGLVFS
jgi:hypothetical protein